MTDEMRVSFGFPLRVCIQTDVGKVRTNNEDSHGYAWLPDGSLFVIVADGMGGHEAGEVASGLAVQVLEEVISRDLEADPRERLYHGLLEANEAILQEGRASGTRGMGTTAIAMLCRGPEVHVGLVGDSRLYHIRKGQLIWRTLDHTRVQMLIDQGQITEDEAKKNPEAGMLTRALGHSKMADGRPLVPDVLAEPVRMDRDDALVLCSDGLHDLVEDWEIGRIVAGKTPATAAADLVRVAVDRGGHDNITVAVVTAGERTAPFEETPLEERHHDEAPFKEPSVEAPASRVPPSAPPPAPAAPAGLTPAPAAAELAHEPLHPSHLPAPAASVPEDLLDTVHQTPRRTQTPPSRPPPPPMSAPLPAPAAPPTLMVPGMAPAASPPPPPAAPPVPPLPPAAQGSAAPGAASAVLPSPMSAPPPPPGLQEAPAAPSQEAPQGVLQLGAVEHAPLEPMPLSKGKHASSPPPLAPLTPQWRQDETDLVMSAPALAPGAPVAAGRSPLVVAESTVTGPVPAEISAEGAVAPRGPTTLVFGLAAMSVIMIVAGGAILLFALFAAIYVWMTL